MDAIKTQPILSETPSVAKRAAKLRVSIVSDSIANRNGVGTYYKDLIAHLEPFVDHISLVCPKIERDRTLEKFSLPMPGDGTQRLVWPRLSYLNATLDEQAPNVMVIPTLGACSYFGFQYARRNKIPVVYVHHTDFNQLLKLYWPGWIANPLHIVLRKLNRWLIDQADSVAALNSHAYEDAASRNVDSIRVMGTPVGAEFLLEPIKPRDKQIRRVIFVGRLAKEKGISNILSAANDLPDVQFAFAGDGPFRSTVESAARDQSNIQYLGWLNRQEVLEALDDSDMLVLPSSIESFGTVALEALARCRYVLTRQECGIATWPSLGRGLFYIQQNESISDALRRIINMPSATRDEIASRSWEAVRDFNQNTVRLWLSFLADAVAEYGPGKKADSESKSAVATANEQA